MTDPYVQRQLKNYQQAQSQAGKDNALYRLGTHLEIIECNGNANLTEEQRQTVLDAAAKVKADE
ncbi:hypothetical protein [Fortiea contorta]|uniref:hypothetical protein n=1 Tax=Fortiea contorta TaxID=1892405 RepID=UPI0003452281|nr:hypothetical protein [Fortiea contorta]